MRPWIPLSLILLALLPVSATRAQDLGRLFTTIPERSTLDQLRAESQIKRTEPPPEPDPVASEPSDEPQLPVVSRLEINGLVRRSGGPATVWVNGSQVERGMVSREGLRVDARGGQRSGVRIELPSGVRSVRLKPGQAVDVTSGTLVDAFQKPRDGALAFEVPNPEPDVAAPPAALASEVRAAERTQVAVPARSAPVDSGLSDVLRDELSRMSAEGRRAALDALRSAGLLAEEARDVGAEQ